MSTNPDDDFWDHERPAEEWTALLLAPDDLLKFFTTAATSTAVQRMSVTLWVRGEIITGDIISPRLWCEELASQLDAAPGNSGGVGDVIRTWGQNNFPSDSELEAAGEERTHLTLVAHVRTLEDVYMRVRLSSIDAWHIGYVTD